MLLLQPEAALRHLDVHSKGRERRLRSGHSESELSLQIPFLCYPPSEE